MGCARSPLLVRGSIGGGASMLYLPRSIQADYLAQPVCELKNRPCAIPHPRAPERRATAADGRHRRRDLAVRPSRRSGDPTGSFHAIDGIPHFLSSAAAAHLLSLAEDFDLVWCSGWEEKAEEYLPHLLGLPAGPAVPALRARPGRGPLDRRPLEARRDRRLRRQSARWRGSTTPSIGPATRGPSSARRRRCWCETDPSRGLTSEEAWLLAEWALAPTRPPAAAPS